MRNPRTTLALLAVLTAPTHAYAGGVVLEVHVGQRSSEGAAALAPVLRELNAQGFRAGWKAVGSEYEAKVSRPSAGGDRDLSARLPELVKIGFRMWNKGKFAEAVETLEPVITAVQTDPAIIANEQTHRPLIFQALVGLSLSHDRLGNGARARELMGDLVRAFPDIELSRATYGPEAQTLYLEVRQTLAGQGRGALVVDVDDAGAAIFISERFAGFGRYVDNDLGVGTYRIYVLRPGESERGRIYMVNVKRDTQVRLEVSRIFDARLHSGPGWTGIVYESATERDRNQVLDGTRFARALDGKGLVLVGVEAIDRGSAVVGRVVDVNSGTELRKGIVSIMPQPDPDLLTALGRFLAGGPAAPGIQVAGGADPPVRRDRPDRKRRRGLHPAWKWAAAGGAVVAVGVGGWLVHIDSTCRDDACLNLWDTKLSGYLSIGAGVGLGGLAGYLFWREHRERRRALTVAPTAGGGAAVVFGGEF